MVGIISASLVGLIVGLFINNTKRQSKSSVLSGCVDNISLENEVLKDKVKQLESKVKTLEKALELTSKS